ncbi:MAG: FHA domain-containing protein [Myxococcota bacterium]
MKLDCTRRGLRGGSLRFLGRQERSQDHDEERGKQLHGCARNSSGFPAWGGHRKDDGVRALDFGRESRLGLASGPRRERSQESAAVAFVVVEEKGEQVLRTELRGPSMSIGRDEANDLRLENRALSRRHAQLEVRGASIWIRDLGSQNGTFINGERLEGARPIQGGDIISLGGKFQLRLEGVEEAKTSTPVLTLTGPEGSHRFAMVGEEIVIGRSPDCDISIGRKSISRRHLRVVLKDGKFFAEDLGSQNGTRVNGEKIRGLTPVGPDDEIRVSEYTIRVSYLEQSESASAEADAPHAHKPGNRTMLLDKSKLAAAADMGGDFEVQVTHENRLAFGPQGAEKGAAAKEELEGPGSVDWQEGDEAGETVGVSQPPPLPPGKGPAPKAPIPTKAPPPLRPPTGLQTTGTKSPAVKLPEASLEVSHSDGATRTVKLKKDWAYVAEDGSEGGPPDGLNYAPTGYLLFAATPTGWMVTAVGDRRFPQVAGKPTPVHSLRDGDVVSLGGVQVTYREA